MYKAKPYRTVAPRPRTRARTGWEPAYVSAREEAPMGAIDDERGDDSSESERLIEEGNARAARDQRLLAIFV